MTDTAERATVTTARYAINAAHASWLRRVLVGFGVFVLLTVAVTVTVSLLVNFMPAQKPPSAVKYAVLNKTLA